METGFSEIESLTLTLILSTRSHFDTVVFSMSEERFSVNQSTNKDLRVKDLWSTNHKIRVKLNNIGRQFATQNHARTTKIMFPPPNQTSYTRTCK